MAKFTRLKVTLLWMVIATFSVTKGQNIMDPVFEVLAAWPDREAEGNPLANVSQQCYQHTQGYLVSLLYSIETSRRMYYSTGSYQADYDLTWNLKDVGDYVMCRDVETPQYNAQYCYVGTRLDKDNWVNLGTCFPDSCSNEDVSIFVLEGFKNLSANPFYETNSNCMPVSYPYRAQDIAAIILCIILLVVIVIGTSYDLVKTYKAKQAENDKSTPQKTQVTPEPNGEVESTRINGDDSEQQVSLNDPQVDVPKYDAVSSPSQSDLNVAEQTPKTNTCTDKLQKCLLAFSCIDVGSRILKAKHSKGSIPCLNGIRVLSMFWIILFHTYLYGATSAPQITNVRYVEEYVKTRPAAMALNKGDLGVEAFLVLSGLLTCYLTLKQFDKCGGPSKNNWFLFYFHRFWRLTPVYMFTIMIYATLTLHMDMGIWSSNWYGAQYLCQERWWANFLYIHNLYPFPGDVSQCMGWTWYLSLDMQLYWLSPIFIIAFYRHWIIGTVLCIVVAVVTLGLSGFFATVQGMSIWGTSGAYRIPMFTPGSWLYSKPYYRISEYLVGIALGYIFYRLKGKDVKIKRWLNYLLWAIAACVALCVVYMPYLSGEDTSAGSAAFYMTIHRLAFSLCVGWVIFACGTGNGGAVNTFLSWPAWLPLARMNYSAYLVHLTVIFVYMWGLNDVIHYSDFNFAVMYIALLVVTYGVAFVIATAVEMPMIGLEKVLIPGRNKKSE